MDPARANNQEREKTTINTQLTKLCLIYVALLFTTTSGWKWICHSNLYIKIVLELKNVVYTNRFYLLRTFVMNHGTEDSGYCISKIVCQKD